ncbi:hypothetical protein [Mucilaginibacter lappiensis]|uniref:Lipoprotein n=1 Tax=Mucilaginibacter lappiensis TaxID=354630 RepID=A0A1N6VKU2_9SPHI|nr:hypothetical protein [Mucilaginibacter lappiensis]MBB6109171.1 hypothetical protein [Mucilaginibacter lappiensis]MBB6127235.1 hypothetical protein [Mucilaginibacter lappiensis]SIQ78503.1 hypothetical protein SAMN05421821_103408 [Mucilaginibacter lappiensis]
MKNFLALLCLLSAMMVISCSKSDKVNPSPQDILNKKISDILPQKYIDTLAKLGLVVNQGTTPPNVEGAFRIAPLILKNSNIKTDYTGQVFHDASVKFFEQSTSDFGIKLVGKFFLNAADTSITTAISGSGNNFTVYGKVKSVSADKSKYAYFGILLSGTKDGTSLKNVTYGIINIDNTNGTGVFINEGQGRVAYDQDGVSESINFDAVSSFKNGERVFLTTPSKP